MATSEMLLPALLAVTGCVLALWAYSLLRRERADQRTEALSDRALFDSGKAAAERRDSEGSPQKRLSTVPQTAGVAAGAVVAFAATTAVTGQALAGVGIAAAVVTGVWMRAEAARTQRRELFDKQFVRMLPQLAASVRSSLTIERALRVACARTEEPLRDELTRVIADVTYGTPLATSLEDMARRTGSADVYALASATRMQQRFGGSLAPVLDMVAAHANVRMKASRELKTEIAGTRLAKWFVALSMPCIFLLMYATNADFAYFYTSEPLGWAMLGGAALLEVVGLAACRSITRFDHGESRPPKRRKRSVQPGSVQEGK